jgi:hypothetical protein
MSAEQLRQQLLQDMDAIVNAPRLWVGRDQRRRATACRVYLAQAPAGVMAEILGYHNSLSVTAAADAAHDAAHDGAEAAKRETL